MAAQAAVTNPPVVAAPPVADPAKPADGAAAKPAEGAAPPPEGGKPVVEAKAEAKPGDKPADGAEKPLEFKLPDGVTLDEKATEAYRAAFKDWGIKDPEVAAKVVAADAARLSAMQKAEADAWVDQGKKWRAELEADKVFGGSPENIKASDMAISRARTLFPNEWNALSGELTKLGLENFPPLSKFMRALGLANAEDKAANPGGGAGAGPKKKDEIFAEFNKAPTAAA